MFNEINLVLLEDLTILKPNMITPYGTIISIGKQKIEKYNVSIPSNSRACLYLDISDKISVKPKGIKIFNENKSKIVHLESGSFSIMIEK